MMVPGSMAKSGSMISQETVCINGKCKSKMQNCSGKNCKVSYNNNVNINSLKTLQHHGFRGGSRTSSGFIADLLKWDPFDSMSNVFSDLFGGHKQIQKESNQQAIKRLTQKI